MLSSETVCSAIICINHLMLVYMLSNLSREMEGLVAAVRVPLRRVTIVCRFGTGNRWVESEGMDGQ